MRWKRCYLQVGELTGLIWAAALMRPSKSVSDMEYPALRKSSKISASLRASEEYIEEKMNEC